MPEKVDPATVAAAGRPEDLTIRRFLVDLTTLSVAFEEPRCRDLDDALGGIGRATRLLEEHDVADAYDAAAPLVMNLGALSGTALMTGLRTFVHGYSPLKVSRAGKPGALGLSSYSGVLRSQMQKVVPRPGVLSTVMRPP